MHVCTCMCRWGSDHENATCTCMCALDSDGLSSDLVNN